MKRLQLLFAIGLLSSFFVLNGYASDSYIFSDKFVALQRQIISEDSLHTLIEQTDSLRQFGDATELIENLIDCGLYSQFYGDYAQSINHLYEAITVATEENNEELKWGCLP